MGTTTSKDANLKTSDLKIAPSFLLLLLGAIFSFSSASAEDRAGDAIHFQTFMTHSRIEFTVDDSVRVEWKETPAGFQALFKGLNLADMGAPLGQEAAWAQHYEQMNESRISSLHFAETADGVRVEGSWKFPSGPDAPAEPRMETFQYREKKPGRYVVDFWPKEGPTLAALQARQKIEAKKTAEQKVQKQIKTRIDRRVAAQTEKKEKNDLGRFCREPLKDGRDVFLPFYAVHEPVDFSKYISPVSPDNEFPYYVPTAKTREAQYVRLALDLYNNQGKPALVSRTIDFLLAEFPHTEYRNEATFLRANAMIRLGMNEEADKILETLRVDARGTPVALHSAMYLAGKLVTAKSYLAAHEAFSWLIQNYPEHQLAWLFHLGSAESLYAIQDTDRAAKEYQWVVENAKTPEQKADAALRLGDVYLDRSMYEQALAAYSQGLRYFGNQAKKFPAIHLNRGEVLVGLQKFDQARDELKKYLDQYPNYPQGWRAAFRLGEIAERKGKQAEARPWYYQAINRFPFSSGSTLARLRLLPCGDHGGFTYEAAVRFLDNDAEKFGVPGEGGFGPEARFQEVAMTHYPDLRALARVRTLLSYGREAGQGAVASERLLKAVDVAQAEIVRIRAPEVKAQLQSVYESLFRRNILNLLAEGKKYEALAFFQERSQYLNGRGLAAGDPEYLLKLSYAASDLGLGKLGETLADEHQRALRGERSIAAVGGPKLAPDMDAKLDTSEQKFAEARALWISPQGGLAAEKKVREKLDQVITESQQGFEKEVILGVMEDKLGHPATALPHVAKAELLANSPATSAADLLRIRAWLADLQSKAGDANAALTLYRTVESTLRAAEKKKPEEKAKEESKEASKEEKKVATTTSPLDILGVEPAPNLEHVLVAQGMILDTKGRWGEAATAYAKAVDAGVGGNQAMYGYAHALLKKGGTDEREKALSVLDRLAQSKTEDFWKKLGSETLGAERGEAPKPKGQQ